MKVVRITGGLSSAYDYRCVITEVEVLHRLGDDPQAFLLSPYMGCERRDWLSPFGDLHILTRYYAGGTLECYLGRLSHREVWLVTAELVMGLRWLHTQGYVHHDLKPANILVDSAGHCVISDFNSCKRLENGKLRRCTADDVVITQNYAAPELVDGRDAEYDQSVDIWSLGVVMSELLTGKLFGDEGSSTKRSLSQMCDDALSRMAAVEGACSYMVNLACRILVEDPSERMSLDSISRYPGFDIHMWVIGSALGPLCLADTGCVQGHQVGRRLAEA
ncbi:kinase-like domain-containing protein [Rhodofomes roseus]|uniref:Kinase-like domain-containing protein n=1 Tax=Rhodofomes roseus TaxID=34475 RepID=A0ABQ8KCE7_9APHY|nr:kinase-like domain-containing protein [Rhodofomes roseus]KAH9834879.1 kinase-like domain-containing protein [Rhodofomes roseus]